MDTRINHIASFGQGAKIHYISIFEDDKLGWHRKFAVSCGVESRHNVHGIRVHQGLTLDDVDCAKCRARIEWIKTQVSEEELPLRFTLNESFDCEE